MSGTNHRRGAVKCCNVFLFCFVFLLCFGGAASGELWSLSFWGKDPQMSDRKLWIDVFKIAFGVAEHHGRL